MNSAIYFNIRLIIAGMLLVLGACLSLGIIPTKLRDSIFDSSRRCIGVAIMVMPISTFLVYFLSLRSLMYNLHVASYLTSCYLISILVTVGFVPLLAGKLNFHHPHFKKRFIRGLVGVPVFAMPMVLANIYGDEHICEVTKVITAILLITAISYQSYTFFKLYYEAIRRGSNYYSEDVEVDINWIIKSVFLFFTLEIICAVSAFFHSMSYTFEMLLTIYRAGTILYVFYQFVKFMQNFESMMSVCESPQIDEVDIDSKESYYKSLTEEQKSQISKRLEQWISQNGYTKIGITIDDVATHAATNRTYMSIYINSIYGCSFKAWVTSLRVKRAKVLLLKDSLTIDDVSRSVGFSSSQSFMHSFKRIEECTPTQWRNTNKKIDI